MNEIDNLYRCNKCGHVAEIKGEVVMCMQPFILRTYGICGGRYINVFKETQRLILEGVENYIYFGI